MTHPRYLLILLGVILLSVLVRITNSNAQNPGQALQVLSHKVRAPVI